MLDEIETRRWWEDLEDDLEGEDDDGVDGLWGRWGGGRSWGGASVTRATSGAEGAMRLASAIRMCQGLVDTFATGERGYRVAFDAGRTAYTNYGAKVVAISHRPLFDPTLDEAGANAVMYGLTAHEASHVRYGGRSRAGAVAAAHPGDEDRAHAVSNLLEDVRIERRFVADYPGFAGLFAPVIRWVARDGLREAGLDPDADRFPVAGGFQLAVASTRYPEYADLAGRESDVEWWQQWAATYTATDATRLHLEGVAAALERLGDETFGQPPIPTCALDGTGQPGATGPGSGSQAPGSDGGLTDAEAQDLANAASVLVEDPETGALGEVHWSPRPLISGRERVARDGSAASVIRAAFARSRTGRSGVERHQTRGRVDNRGLARLPMGDRRLFNRRVAPSEGRYDVWVMVDCSGSMGGTPIADATSVASALAAASRSVPTMRLSVWGWTSAWRFSSSFGAVRAWTSGDPLANLGYLPNVRRGGTPDAAMFRWAARAIRADCRPGETPILIVASDGEGYMTRALVEDARRAGVEVVSVALGDLDASRQREVYGERGFVPWAGTISATARPLGRLLARAVGS